MGLWDETCCITSLPIFPNDPCVLVVLSRESLEARQEPLEGVEPMAEDLLAVHRGTYDGYGWVDGAEGGDEKDSQVVLLFHRGVWDAVVKQAGKLPKKPSRDAAEFDAVVHFASTTRRDVLVGNRYHGVQDHRAIESYELLLKLMEAAMKGYRESVENRG